MNRIILKNPRATYRQRLNRFLWLLISVRGLEPRDLHLWRGMDGNAFQDTETALETELHNEGRSLDAQQAERLSLAVTSKSKKKSQASDD